MLANQFTLIFLENIVKYFKIYEVYIPTEHKVKAKFAGPLVTRKQVFTHKKKELPEGKDKTNT